MSNYYRPSMFGGFSFFPPVIKILLLANGVAFLFVEVFGRFTLGGYSLYGIIYEYFALWPLAYGFLPWQLVSYQFMHAGFSHILYNLFGLWMFGMEIEHIWGSKKFLIYYLLCGIVAGVFQLVLSPILEPSQVIAPTVGASGAIYGVLIAFGMMFPDRYIYLYFFVPVKAKYFVGGLIILGVFAIGGSGNVANLAHLGGALAGYLYILYDRRQIPLAGVFDRLRRTMERQYAEKQPQEEVKEAKFFDIRDAQKKDEKQSNQQKVDEILDKISRDGYQRLTDEEKKILFEASKKLN